MVKDSAFHGKLSSWNTDFGMNVSAVKITAEDAEDAEVRKERVKFEELVSRAGSKSDRSSNHYLLFFPSNLLMVRKVQSEFRAYPRF